MLFTKGVYTYIWTKISTVYVVRYGSFPGGAHSIANLAFFLWIQALHRVLRFWPE